MIGVDTEGNSLRAHEPGVSFLVQWAGADYEECESGCDVPAFRAVLERESELWFANASYDVHCIRSTWGIDLLRSGHKIRDVQTLARIVVPGRFDYRLESLADKYLGTDSTVQQRELKELAKTLGIGTLKQEGAHRAIWDAYPHKLEAYGMEDVRITYDLVGKLMQYASPSDLRVFDMECEVQRVLMTAEQYGVMVDKTELALLRTRLEASLSDAHAKLLDWLPAEALGSDDSPASQSALREGLLAAGVPLYAHTPSSGKVNLKTGKKRPIVYATNKDALSEFKTSNEVIGLLFEWRRLGKVLSTYVAALERANPRVHASFLSCEARTSRMSCIAEGSLVAQAYSAPLPIERVRPGSVVRSHDDDGVVRDQKVLAQTYMGVKPIMRLSWVRGKEYGWLNATPDHRIRRIDGTYACLDELRYGDAVAHLHGEARVLGMYAAGEAPTWDLTIENTPCFVANEIGVHNCRSPNLQNLPRGSGARNAIIPEKGNALVVCDYDSIEVWILAHYLSRQLNDQRLMDKLKAGLDQHRDSAAFLHSRGFIPLVAGAPPRHAPMEELKAYYSKGAPGEKARAEAKNSATFPAIYGAGDASISRGLGLPVGTKGVKNAVLEALPGYFDLYDAVMKHARRVGFLRTVTGRRLDTPKGKNHILVNSIIQGSAAEALKLGMLAAEAPLRELGYQIVLVVHDELVSEGPVESAPAALEAQRAAMESVGMALDHEGRRIFDCPLKATGSYTTKSYGEAK